MDHQGLKVYKIYINDDPGVTLTYFTAMSNLVLIAYCALYKTHSKVSVYRTIGPLVLPSKPKSCRVSKNFIESMFWFQQTRPLTTLLMFVDYNILILYSRNLVLRKFIYRRGVKGSPISKALTCMKIYLYKQKMQFCQGG